MQKNDRNEDNTQISWPYDERFLKVAADKKPLEKGWPTYPWEEVQNFPNIGILVDHGFVVVDVDSLRHATKLLNLIESVGIRCRVMQTDKGMHFWFKSSKPMTNNARTMTAIGLPVDYRSWGHKKG